MIDTTIVSDGGGVIDLVWKALYAVVALVSYFVGRGRRRR